MKKRFRFKPLWLACACICATSAAAEPFQLGEIQVTASGLDPLTGAVKTIDQEELRLFNRETVGKALNIMPGVTLTEGGARNEQMLTLRGFDLRQVPVFVDGIPVYVSYDGYVDLGRFNTFDLSGIDVSKSFSSVLYGPNALGGAINLISRKPTKQLEGDVTLGLYLNNQFGYNGLHTDANAGGNYGSWYWQASASYLNKDQFRLSEDFKATKYEDGGDRGNSYNNDKKINLKLGWTPREGDEYTVNYINQQGEKGTPVYAGKDVASTNNVRFWQWPYWDKESLYLLSRTRLGEDSYIKFRVYYDKFQNSIANYSNGTYRVLKATPFYQSWYDDYSYGASAEFGTKLYESNTLKLAMHLKDDVHREHNRGNPIQRFKDRTTSFALEDTQRLGEKFDLVFGVSRDERGTREAQNLVAGKLVNFQKDETDAWNPQIGLFYHASASDEIHATISRKSRFPTIKDRYSYRLGTAIPNAGLQAESSTNFEIGASGLIDPKVRVEGAFFYYDVQDMIQSVNILPKNQCGATATTCTQMQNIGNVTTKGLEFGVTANPLDTLEIGVNYTWLDRVNETNPTIRLTDVPRHKLFSYAKWQVYGPLTVLGSVEVNSWRCSASDATRVAGGFGLANLKAMYKVNDAWSGEFGVNNLLDKNYATSEGYPLEGRNFFINGTWKF
ncbi:MAG: TonB-dependent receptor [Methylophilaceae bacterium]|nr:TonB-dependent receptor [Methylophilaceae bacterium]